MIVWSRRALVACSGLWLALVTAYAVLSSTDHEALPSPYNALVMFVLTTLTLGSATAWLSGWVAKRALDDVRVVVVDAASALGLTADLHYNRIFGILGAVERDTRERLTAIEGRLDKMDAPTVVLPRLRVVGSAEAPTGTLVRKLDPEVHDLTRRIRENQERDGA